MSNTVEAILEQVRVLPPAELREVSDEILRLQNQTRQWEEQKKILRDTQRRHKGSGFLNQLLETRREDRRRE